MSRDYIKPTSSESYAQTGMFTVTPNASTVRYPANLNVKFIDTTASGGLGTPVDQFIIRNKSAAEIRVVVDGDASASAGHIVDAGEDYRLPQRGINYISVYGGDGTAIRIHWYAF